MAIRRLVQTFSSSHHQHKALCLLLALLASGCNLTPSNPLTNNGLAGIEGDLQELETLVAATRADLQTLSSQQDEQLSQVTKRLRNIDGGVKEVPQLIANACQTPAAIPTACEEVAAQTVVSSDDKMIVGAAEYLWVSPPGIQLTANIDTGTNNNSIHATDVTPFERDGDDWVRFTLSPLAADNDDEGVKVERKIVRLMRTSKRPVVRLRIKLGNVLDSFEFILSDRSKSDHRVELGRNFLQDVALVDVGKQFVQPRFDNSKKKSGSGTSSSGN